MLRERRIIRHEINSGSIADIAFLLLIFFLLTSTMDRKYVLRRMAPTASKQDETTALANRNLLTLSINAADELSINGKPGGFADVESSIKEFILNPQDDKGLADKELKSVKLQGMVPVSVGVVSIKTDDNTSYSAYYKLQDAINKAYFDIKNQRALKVFGTSYGKLDDIRRASIDENIPVNINE